MQAEAGGHGFSTGREIKGLSDLLAKTGSVKSVAAEAAQNALTHAQEFKWGDTFMTFSYQNKGGKLFANGRPFADISDANEVGGDRMGRVTNALNKMITNGNIAESIVVSEDLGYGRHFIYRYRKGEGDDIEGLAFEYQGTPEELSEVVNQLGKRAVDHLPDKPKESFDFSKPLFFTQENKNSIEDLSQAAHKSFKTDTRKKEMRSYLDRLDRDTTQFDLLVKRRQMQEEELTQKFKEIILANKDVRTGIAAAVYGAINIAEKMGKGEDRRRVESQQIVINQSENIRKYNAGDLLDLLTSGVKAIPAFVDHMGRFIDRRKIIDITQVAHQRVEEHNLRTAQVQTKESITPQVIEPLVIGLVGLTAAISAITDDNLNQDKENKCQDILPIELEQLLWREFITAIFMPTGIAGQNDEILFSEQTELGRAEKVNGFLSDEMSLGDILVEFISTVDDSETQKPLLVAEPKNSKVFTAGFQQGLAIIAQFVTDQEGSESGRKPEGEKTGQKVIEASVLGLGEVLLGVLVDNLRTEEGIKDITKKPQADSLLARLSFLLHVYHDPDSSEVAKHLLAVFIYKEAGKIMSDNVEFTQNPKFERIWRMFVEIVPRASFLDAQFDILVAFLKKNYPTVMINESENGDLIGQIIYIIFQLHKPQFSFEKLPSMAGRKIYNNKRNKPKQGIIYQYYFEKRLRYLSRSVDV